MTTYAIDFDGAAPYGEFNAVDLVDLGEQIAYHLGVHQVLTSGTYDALIGDTHGEIAQAGRRPTTFTITRKAA
jgi:hypothetical protein